MRTFEGNDIPWKSRFGNVLTIRVLQYVSGLKISDTQTGLRGIPISFMGELIDVPGERFEFETRMLLQSCGKYDITEVSIKTVYDSKENHQTHFRPIIDSIKIYRILGFQFIKFIFASLSSSILDLVLFAVFCRLLGHHRWYIAASTVAARVLSAAYNYVVNYRVVFRSNETLSRSAGKYIVLAICQMAASAVLVTLFVSLLPAVPEVIVKMVIDTGLFFISYHLQQKYIFQRS